MKKLVYLIAAIAVALAGCSKKDKGNSNPYNYNPYGYGYNSCYGSGYNNNYSTTYQWRNGQCVDVRNNQPVAQQYCQNTNNLPGNNFGANCNYFGGYNQFYGQNSNICSQFNDPYSGTVTYPVFFPSTGQTLCVEYATYQFIGNYGTPYIPPMYAGYGYQAIGCVPGYNVPAGCTCASFGGQLGWFSAGVQAGICF